MKTKIYRLGKDSPWQRIFLQSKVNGASYGGEELLPFNWNWPKNTYLQDRLQYVRRYRSADERADLYRPGDALIV
jgi:hypothetical protein